MVDSQTKNTNHLNNILSLKLRMIPRKRQDINIEDMLILLLVDLSAGESKVALVKAVQTNCFHLEDE